MGKLIVTIGVGDQQGQQFEDIEVIVDTGSTFTALPAAMLHELGVMVEHTAEARLADGRTTPVQIGHTTIRLEGRTFPTPRHIRPGQRAQPPRRRHPGNRPPRRRSRQPAPHPRHSRPPLVLSQS